MSQMEMEKVYSPGKIERPIYDKWLSSNAFHADPKAVNGKKGFCIVIPPPNVTAPLHLGHALNNTLQDIIIRQKRMAGFETLWMPGTDHAGIATQTVVEKRILTEEGKRRTDFTREEFIARVQQWKDEYEARIIEQLKAMGCSCDWARTRFTMDEICARAVREAFFRLFKDGLIYRGKRLVNWDPATQTVLADDEVEYQTVQGHFWYLRYPLVEPIKIDNETIEYVTVATTRPETMLGDTAVAMNPADPRAKYLLGKKVRLPIVGRVIPIIADEHVVLSDPNSDDEKARFSTGFLKVTPAHDPDDWEIGQRHNLPIVNVMAPDGTISDKFGWDDARGTDAEQFLGLDRFEAREAIVEWFRKENLLEDVREYTHEVGHSYRSHVPIEPYLSDQWFIAVKKQIPSLPDEGKIEGTDIPVNSLAGLALKPLLDGRLKFIPERYAKTYQSWLENLRDWPISRQLWWGHRIPIWSKAGKDDSTDLPDGLALRQVESENGKIIYACIAAGHEDLEARLQADGFERDPDVLDTWFSSALWPISTMGWPEETDLLKVFYPTDVLCTAREIITLWVSRMVMFGEYFRGEIPFREVYVHAMIQDGQGRKMSKSLGNGIDPLDIIESHGTDAMRFTLAHMTTETQDVRMPVVEMTLPDGRRANSSPKFDIGRNFCNKLWNAARFVMMNLTDMPRWSEINPRENLADAWILSQLNQTIALTTEHLSKYHFHDAVDGLYHFMWNDFCDWYLEIAKIRINTGQTSPKAILAYVLDSLLRLLHPIIPFITEYIWSKLNEVAPIRGPGESPAEELLIRARWPEADNALIDKTVEEDFRLRYQQAVRSVRNIRAEHNVPPKKQIDILLQADGRAGEVILNNRDLFQAQCASKLTVIDKQIAIPKDAVIITVEDAKLYITGVIDRQAELARLTKRRKELIARIESAEKKLANPEFLNKAPQEVVSRQRERLKSLKEELHAVEKNLSEAK